MAAINHTTPERFQAAQAMLEKAIAAEPDNVDLEAALAAHLLRGIQTGLVQTGRRRRRGAQRPVDAGARAAGQADLSSRARRLLPLPRRDQRIHRKPGGLRQGIALDPWDGLALYNLGLTQFQLGRFEDALATFKQADQFDTPQVSRWTWLLGAGVAYLLMDRDEEAINWLQRSIAITPAPGPLAFWPRPISGWAGPRRPERRWRRPWNCGPVRPRANIALPTRNASPVYLEASERIIQALVEAGLPER